MVDTNILLKQVHLRDLLKVDQETFDSQYEVFTLDAVLAEVKDEKSREYIQHKLPYQLTTKSAATYLNPNDNIRVENFAKDTGDFIGLSKVDMLVISMGMQLARERGELNLVRKVPKALEEFRPESLKKAYDAFESEDDSEESDEAQ